MKLLARYLSRLLVILALVTVSGMPAFAAAAIGVDACADTCDEEAEEGGRSCPQDEENGGCPPFCHACPCAPLYMAPPALETPEVFSGSLRTAALVLENQVRPSPLLRGVFHPPRLSA